MDFDLTGIDEDTCEYVIVLKGTGISLEDLRQTAYTIKEQLRGFIWHKEPFNLEPSNLFRIPCLTGTTNYGDSLNDESAVLYILYQVSLKYPDAFTRIEDHDGELLLIEASDSLPNWLSPENSGYRVWINNGKVLVIPLSYGDGKALDLKSSYEYIQTFATISESFFTSPAVDQLAFTSIQKFPSMEQSIQRSRVIIPRKLATVLHQHPFLIAPAAQEFFQKDISNKQVISNMSVFPPTDLVTCTVPFSRLIYARFMSERFTPPSKMAGLLPPTSEIEYDDAMLGVKILAAFELLADRAKTLKVLDVDNVAKDSDFKAHATLLAQNGYFQGEIPGSSRYIELLDLAKRGFISRREMENQTARLPLWLDQVKEATDQDIQHWDSTIDSDDWMKVKFEDLDESGNVKASNEFEDRLQGIMDSVEEFFKDESGLEGIGEDEEREVYGEEDEDENEEENENENDEGEVKFNDSDPDIDEDDFLEFFLKEALKLSPEEIESYRADNLEDVSDTDPTSEEAVMRKEAKKKLEEEQGTENISKTKPKVSKGNSKKKVSLMNTDRFESGAELKSSRRYTEELEPMSSSDDEDYLYQQELLDEELRDHGIIGNEADRGREIMQNLLESFSAGGGVSGPAAAFFSQLGLKLPREE